MGKRTHRLVINRKFGQAVVINKDFVIRVDKGPGRSVKLLFNTQGKEKYQIVREELENKDAGTHSQKKS